jgi:sarcosine oxidase subunit beta
VSYDIVVIGAGSVGTPAAFYLAREGLKVLVIDRLPSPGQGSNKAAIGGVRATHSDPAKIRLGLRTIEILTSFKDEFGYDVEWRPGGYVFVAYRPEEEKTLRELVALQRSFGLDIRWCNADELLKVVPDLNPKGLRGGTYSPGDGHCSPLLLNHAYYELARKAGAEFHFREEVLGFEGARRKDSCSAHGSWRLSDNLRSQCCRRLGRPCGKAFGNRTSGLSRLP